LERVWLQCHLAAGQSGIRSNHGSPDHTKRYLELNLTNESFDFHIIPGVVPNRGLNPQTDLSLYGLHYLQRVSDADAKPFSTAGEALHN